MQRKNYAILPIKPKGVRLLGRRSELPADWAEDYTKTLAALSSLNMNKPLDRERAAQLEAYLDRLADQLHHAGRGKLGYRPKVDSFNRYPTIPSIPLKNLKTAIRANSPRHTREKAWESVAASGIPFRPGLGESVLMKKRTGMDALDQRHFMETAAVSLPIAKGREPGLLGEKVPGEVNMGPFGTRTIKGKQFLGGDFTGFSPMKFSLTAAQKKRRKHLSTGLAIAGTGAALTGIAENTGAGADIAAMTAHAINHAVDNMEADSALKHALPEYPASKVKPGVFSRAKKKIAGVANKHGHELPASWRFPTMGMSANRIIKRRIIGAMGLTTGGILAIDAAHQLRKSLNKKKEYSFVMPHAPVIHEVDLRTRRKRNREYRKFTVQRYETPVPGRFGKAIQVAGKVAGAVGAIGLVGMPAIEYPGYNMGFKKGEQGELLGRRQRSLRRFVPGYMTGFTDGRETMKARKEMTGYALSSPSETYYYEAGFSAGISSHWKRIKEAFRRDFKPTVIRGAFVGGLGKIHQEVGLPPTTVDGIPVNRRSFDSSFAPFSTQQLHKVHDDLVDRMRVGDYDPSKGEQLRKVIQDLEKEMIARRALPSV